MKRFLGFPIPLLAIVEPENASAPSRAMPPQRCPRCREVLAGTPNHARFRVCDACGFHDRRTARETINQLVDRDSFRETAARLTSTDPLAFADDVPYRERLGESRDRTGECDALVTGTARLRGQPIVLAVLDFSFMGGSMGVVVGEKIARAADLARQSRRPLLTIVASGGARMQEGMLSLLQMAKTTAAVKRLQDSGIPYLSVLTNPTTGGVFASFANLGDVIVAEPAALIGFAGPRVAEQVIGRKLPPGTHTAEFLLEHGMIDAIVDRVRLRGYLGNLLAILNAPRTGHQSPRQDAVVPAAAATAAAGAWATVLAARSPDRPTSLEYIERILDVFVELHGDRDSGDDPAVVAGLGQLDGRAIAVIGFERGRGEGRGVRHDGRAYPEGYRKAQRVMRLAARLNLPLLTLIDTPGAYPGVEAEERGLAGELAASMALMSDLPTPIVAAVVGEGGSGGALALAVADTVLMQEDAIYSVIAPEGAATILYRDADRAAEISAKLKLTASDLHRLGIVDTIVAEPPAGAGSDLDGAAALLKPAITRSFANLQRLSTDRLVRARFRRYQEIGRPYARDATSKPTASGSLDS